MVPETGGKVVEVETRDSPVGVSPATLSLVAVRYNANGSVDTTFGTNGQTTILANTTDVIEKVHNLTVSPDGSLVMSVEAANYTSTVDQYDAIVVRLTPTGQLDPGFGTNGTVTMPTTSYNVGAVAVQSDNKIVAVSLQEAPGVPYGRDQVVLTRLTTAGTLDTTFNGTGQLIFVLPNDTSATYANSAKTIASADLALTSSGQIYLGTNLEDYSYGSGSVDLTRITTAGAVDTTYGSAGTQTPAIQQFSSMVVQTDNKVVLGGSVINAGSFTQRAQLIRVNTDGTADTTFAGITGTETSGVTTRFSTIGALAIDATGKIVYGEGDGNLIGRLTATGTVDPSFGTNGVMPLNFAEALSFQSPYKGSGTSAGLAVMPTTGDILVGGQVDDSRGFVAQFLPTTIASVSNDYDGDGKTDVAAQLSNLGIFAYRPSTGLADQLQGFGTPGVGNSIPAPGDYDGDGVTDLATYLPKLGEFAYRPSSGGSDDIVSLGTAGAGASIPASGDYDGDGMTDFAVYLPASGSFEVHHSVSGSTVTTSFGMAGAGNSIPCPGDYDGDGKTDLAVYVPSLGVFAYRPSTGGPDVVVAFGKPGAGNSIPVPGDYDGDGRTDFAVYMPTLGVYAYRPSGGGADVLQAFGQIGAGASVPDPGDYNGDGRTDIAVAIPALAQFYYRPSTGGADVGTVFGIAGTSQTIPAASIPYAQPTSTGSTSAVGTGATSPSAVVYIPLTDDLTSPSARKKTTGTA